MANSRRKASTWTRRSAGAVIAALALAGAGAAQVRLPDFGDSSDGAFPSSLEREVGEAFMREIRATSTIVEDPEVASYVQSLGYALVSASEQRSLGFNFFVVKDPRVNAFAAPGGWVGLNSGLVLASESESELAAVLAHEIAHVTQRHIARQVELGERTNVAALAGLLAAVAIGIANPQAGQAAAATVIGTQIQARLDFSRAAEQEADRVGMQMLHDAGFDPSAMATFFEKLQTAGRYYRQPPEFLSTHPVTTSRIADTLGRARQYGVRQHGDSLEYRMVQAKLRLGAEPDTAKLIAYFESEIQKSAPIRAPGLHYGLALAKARAERYPEAREELARLLAEHPGNIPLQVASAEVAVRSGDQAGAERIYRDVHELMPDSPLVTQSYAQALLTMGQPARCLEVLQEHRRLAGMSAEMYRIQADAFARLGRASDSQIALAEHHVLRGNLVAAIQQLRLAARDPGNDFFKSSRIEARIEELEKERARLAQR